jgi:hypothetical protein
MARIMAKMFDERRKREESTARRRSGCAKRGSGSHSSAQVAADSVRTGFTTSLPVAFCSPNVQQRETVRHPSATNPVNQENAKPQFQG